ncbi:DUF4136 domain-containing protein [Blastomonas aquatica]|uniref:DUF4136 domain-containing protein n=1 Tax=Blastomonas aquatica TaxID=1510276 RepID=A0ABQ1ITI6_9SPHN|nr:DUF4136 domain-containing protein [Blastomonas aquatica]GGB50830.1 hypothetical protein GCM10010833_01900 [Blastomonas aquatica]
MTARSRFTRRAALIAVPALALALSACATPFKADVARFQALPAPQGQSFVVTASDPRLQGGLEFGQYAGIVTRQMTQLGYVPASDASRADMVVSFAYMVDNGRERVVSDGFGGGFGGGWGGFGPGFGPWGGGFGRRAFGFGYYDPFIFGPGWNNNVRSYTVYTSEIDLKIDRVADNSRLFEGKAEAQSRSKNLQYLVPNLVEAIFTDFPGQSGETVRISIAPEGEKTVRPVRQRR